MKQAGQAQPGSDPNRSGQPSSGTDPERQSNGDEAAGPSWTGWMGFYKNEPSGPLMQAGEGRLAANRKAAENNSEFEVRKVIVRMVAGG